MTRKRIAVIGGGISGLSAAWALRETADVTVYEARERIGGHSHTMSLDYDGQNVDVDVGFIVYNALNYPNLIALFEALDVETIPSDMSFAVSDPDGWEWASNIRGLCAQKKNLLSPRFHRFWRTILKFNDSAREELAAGKIEDISLGDWLRSHDYDDDFLNNYILPMGAAIWSTPESEMLEYPALSFFNFFENHKLMHKERPKWRTVKGGSKNYVTKLVTALGERINAGSPVQSVKPVDQKIVVELANGSAADFDDVILACHADQSTKLLNDAYAEQLQQLGNIRYRPNDIYVHRDPQLMPKRKAAWASWNVLKQDGEDICLTYWMNLLQDIEKAHPVFVTLNPAIPPKPDLTFSRFEFSHPQFDAPAAKAVTALKSLQGKDGIWLAGAWMGSGFHEDGLKSGLSVALALGGAVPWTAQNLEPYVAPERTQSPPAADTSTIEVFKPFERSFSYRIFMIDVDIDRLNEASKVSSLFSVGRGNLFSFKCEDHGDRLSLSDLRPWAEAEFSKAEINLDGGSIRLVTFPRGLFYKFAPISLWFGYGPDGETRGIIYEVNNTFGETHCYVAAANDERAQHRSKKNFHVSPFWDVTGDYKFTLRPIGDQLSLVIDSLEDGERNHMANIKAKYVPATTGNLLKTALTKPLSALAVTFGIHWEAFHLWRKGAGYRSKPIAPEQRTTIAHTVSSETKQDQAA